jgi:hypothetical protein
MNGHLVAIEVGIESRADQWMKLYCATFNQYRLKGLDTEPVKGGGAIQHNRALFDHFRQYIPDL